MANTNECVLFLSMNDGLVLHLPPIYRLPRLHQALAGQAESTPNNCCEVKSSFHKEMKIALDKSLGEVKLEYRKNYEKLSLHI